MTYITSYDNILEDEDLEKDEDEEKNEESCQIETEPIETDEESYNKD